MRLLWAGLFIAAIALGAVYYNLSKKNPSFTSPLPSYLNRAITFGVSTLNIWLPDIKISTKLEPQVSAKAALLYDLESSETVFAKNPKVKAPIASLVKIMTAIVALESMKLSDVYIVSETAARVGEDSMGISTGERLTLEELLYGLMLVSGNDAAEVIAENFPGGRANFIRAMNDKARSLGLVDTYFINPTGLEEDGTSEYSTVYDLLVITKYALTLPKFTEIVATYEHIIPYSQDHKALYLYNTTNLLTSYPGVLGVKPGFTPKAGLCLVTYAEIGGHKIIGIILNSESRREEMRELLNLLL